MHIHDWNQGTGRSALELDPGNGKTPHPYFSSHRRDWTPGLHGALELKSQVLTTRL